MNRFIKALLKILAGVPVLAVCFFVASDIVVAKAETLTITAAVPGNVDGQGRRYYKFNQIFSNGNFKSYTNWITYNCDLTLDLSWNMGTVTVRTGISNSYLRHDNITGVVGHKYLFVGKAKSVNQASVYLDTLGTHGSVVLSNANEWNTTYYFYTATTTNMPFLITCYQSSATFNLADFMLVDLTLMYGVGYEPTTREQLFPFFQEAYSAQEGVYNYYDYEPNYLAIPLDPRFSWQEATREGEEYDAGYMDAIQYAYNNLYDITLGGVRYLYSNSQSYSAGYADNPGYQQGVNDAASLYSGNLIGNIFSSIGNLLSIQLLPGLSIGVICAVPVVLGLLLFIIKIIRK